MILAQSTPVIAKVSRTDVTIDAARFDPVNGGAKREEFEAEMRFPEKLERGWATSGACLCVGLDPILARMPPAFQYGSRPVLAFNKRVVDLTADLVCAYKPQAAHHGAHAAEADLAETIAYIRARAPHALVILDAKRGDIGSTAEMYAREAFERYDADAVTVNPYMGDDTVTPFLGRDDRGILVLCRTSNPDAGRFQNAVSEGRPLFRAIAHRAQTVWNIRKNVMLVVGATAPAELAEVRAEAPDLAFLIPGYGEQGGDAKAVKAKGRRADGLGLVVSSSRGILWAGSDEAIRGAAERAHAELRHG